MTFRPVYLDTSALAKLVVHERESGALRQWLLAWPDGVTTVLSRVEVARALRRLKATKVAHDRAAEVLRGIAMIRVDDQVLETASSLRDPLLRSIDAIHLASALSIGDAPEAFVTYDIRLAEAARRARLNVVAPV